MTGVSALAPLPLPSRAAKTGLRHHLNDDRRATKGQMQVEKHIWPQPGIPGCPVPPKSGSLSSHLIGVALSLATFYVVGRAPSISGGRDSTFEPVALAFEDEGMRV